MKKVLYSIFLSLCLVQVAPVFADDAKTEVAVVEKTTKKARIKAFLKNRKVALIVGLGALAIAFGGAFVATSSEIECNYDEEQQVDNYKLIKDVLRDAFGNFEVVQYDDSSVCSSLPADGVVARTPEAGKWHCFKTLKKVPCKKALDTKGLEKFKIKLGRTGEQLKSFLNPVKSGEALAGLNRIDWLHLGLDVAAAALIVDLGYNLITGKPELAECIYNRAFRKKAKTEEVVKI